MTGEPAALHWSDAYLLGFGPMDSTHQEFVACVSELQTCADGDVANALQAVHKHCQSHFDEEQRWMEETSFPSRDCHIDEHAKVMKSLNEVVALFQSGGPGPNNIGIARSLAAALADWFPGHADYLDSALSHWMSKQRFGGKPIVIRRNVSGETADQKTPQA
jgi:hemerythrin